MATSSRKSIVFLTGTFLGSNCWDEWKVYFESRGYNCIVPVWPYKKASPEELRNKQPDPGIASNSIQSCWPASRLSRAGFYPSSVIKRSIRFITEYLSTIFRSRCEDLFDGPVRAGTAVTCIFPG